MEGTAGAAFATMMSTLVVHMFSVGNNDSYPISSPAELNKTKAVYDFIIIGAGTSGCVLANRLSENPEWSILLLEAGEYPSRTSEVPALHPMLMQTHEDWSFKTQPSKNSCQGMQKKECRLSSGNVLGGTSTIGNMHYHRANQKDFLVWQNLTDDTWSPENALTHYKRVERDLSSAEFSVNYGTNGEISLNTLTAVDCLRSAILKSTKYLGYGRMKMGDNLGYVETLLTIDGGSRQNSANAFLSPIKDFKKFKLILGAQVTSINFTDPPDLKAQVVEVLYKKCKYTVKARKEIILTAGTINTPKILMASGIGPKDHLKELDIPLVADKKVGYNLQDHFRALVLVSINKCRTEKTVQKHVFEYIMHKSGWLSKINVHDVVGYINTHETPYDIPNVAIYHYFFDKADELLEKFFQKLGFTDKIVQSIVKYNQQNAIIAFMPTLLTPKSTGRVLLKSSNSEEDPVIEGKFLEDEMEEDLETLASAVRYVIRFIESPDFARLTADLLEIDIPNCRNLKLWGDAYIKCMIKNIGFPGSQMVGTVKMSDCCDEGVVDSRLNVKGVRGLRVVDASVIPQTISANLQATLAMMGDRAAELIKEKWVKGYKDGGKKCKACA